MGESPMTSTWSDLPDHYLKVLLKFSFEILKLGQNLDIFIQPDIFPIYIYIFCRMRVRDYPYQNGLYLWLMALGQRKILKKNSLKLAKMFQFWLFYFEHIVQYKFFKRINKTICKMKNQIVSFKHVEMGYFIFVLTSPPPVFFLKKNNIPVKLTLFNFDRTTYSSGV